MSHSSTRLRRILPVVVVAAVAVLVVRRRHAAGRGGDLLPSIGGDTWPPVPVKDTRPA